MLSNILCELASCRVSQCTSLTRSIRQICRLTSPDASKGQKSRDLGGYHLLIQKSMTVDCRGTTTAPLAFHVKENVPGALIGQVLPHNGTTVAMSGTQFLIVNQQDVPDIAIMGDGSLYAPHGLDRETRENYSITVIAESLRGVGVFQVSLSFANRATICYSVFVRPSF